jgi:hypothetical protein
MKQLCLLYLMQALRFYGSSNVTVTGITIVNSSQCHLKFDSCQGVTVNDITISSPENSPNTDGIHLQNSKAVNIHHTNLACGNSHTDHAPLTQVSRNLFEKPPHVLYRYENLLCLLATLDHRRSNKKKKIRTKEESKKTLLKAPAKLTNFYLV